jgi:hypothetical protein
MRRADLPRTAQEAESFIADRCWLDDVAEAAAARVLDGTYDTPDIDSLTDQELHLPLPIGYRTLSPS